MTAETRLRPAVASDVAAIVALLADDMLGAGREGDAADPRYAEAFARVAASPDNTIYVLEDATGVIGCAQLTCIPGLSGLGKTRGQIESVRVAAALRGRGLGRALIRDLVAIARDKGCATVQLTSHKTRLDAHRFYEGLGFKRSHEGFKLDLAP